MAFHVLPSQADQAQNQITNCPQVTDYLVKRGYLRTESIFRKETQNIGSDGRPIYSKADDYGPAKYMKAFDKFKNWVDNCLDIYKFELEKLLWPYFIYSYLELVEDGDVAEAEKFLAYGSTLFKVSHAEDVNALQTIRTKPQIAHHATIRLYRQHKYKIPLSQHIEGQLWSFLNREHDEGGSVVADILNRRCQIEKVSRGPINPYSFEAIYRRGSGLEIDDADAQEGIPGVFTGVTNRDVLENKPTVKLGPLPMDPDLKEDVRAELEDLEGKNAQRSDGKPTLTEEFERLIKREDSTEAPTRDQLPLPASRARDVVTEIQKVRENRDRFKIEGRTDGVGPAVSICMFTFHNTLGTYTCIDFSQDQMLVATGTEDSYIRIWSLDGKALPTKIPSERDLKVNNRKLIGHSDRIYSVHFSSSISPTGFDLWSGENEYRPELSPRFLLSSAADGQVRLWSLETWSCLCVYKSHNGPVMRALWGPHGHYFASAGWDKTVRIWSQEKATPIRLLVGHDTAISAIAWHPNSTLIFSASDETDKTIRMWDVSTGDCVRMFTGHTDYISEMVVAPNGRIFASADAGGNIIFWDIAKGIAIKRSRGHRPGGIWSLSFSVESNVLISGGADGTIRLWDVKSDSKGTSDKSLAGANQGDAHASGSGEVVGASSVGGQASTGNKKKGKELTVTPDQISCFMAKRTPVIKCEFTRMNLIVAGGWYDPER
ncbi:WD domain-containing protein [Zalerion maritima]|uniref:WD domain-containing protein n=1 Tax=Zalerion maritima TaxID=339359 RepID=A0AAD5RGQ1_9PEZI|nr:WD domain-containing protein [Zalerion maritima]